MWPSDEPVHTEAHATTLCGAAHAAKPVAVEHFFTFDRLGVSHVSAVTLCSLGYGFGVGSLTERLIDP